MNNIQIAEYSCHEYSWLYALFQEPLTVFIQSYQLRRRDKMKGTAFLNSNFFFFSFLPTKRALLDPRLL